MNVLSSFGFYSAAIFDLPIACRRQFIMHIIVKCMIPCTCTPLWACCKLLSIYVKSWHTASQDPATGTVQWSSNSHSAGDHVSATDIYRIEQEEGGREGGGDQGGGRGVEYLIVWVKLSHLTEWGVCAWHSHVDHAYAHVWMCMCICTVCMCVRVCICVCLHVCVHDLKVHVCCYAVPPTSVVQ